jgi:hypothetical protein
MIEFVGMSSSVARYSGAREMVYPPMQMISSIYMTIEGAKIGQSKPEEIQDELTVNVGLDLLVR